MLDFCNIPSYNRDNKRTNKKDKFEMIGKRLKDIRKTKGLTQSQLAEIIGVSVSTVKKWEQDKVDPNTAALISIAVALNVSLDYLFGNDAAPDLVVVTNGDTKKIIEVVETLPDSHRRALLQYAELLKRGNEDV